MNRTSLKVSSLFFKKIAHYFTLHPLAISLGIAFISRMTSSLKNYGPGAIDDYINIIGPALRLIQTESSPHIPSLRFEFFPYLLYYFMLFCKTIGFQNPEDLVSGGYFILSILSLVQVWGMYRLGAIYLNEKWRNYFTLLGAIHFIFPFFMTRFYLGTFALMSILWGLYWTKKRKYYQAGLMFALTAFFRFNLAPVYFLIFIYTAKDTKFSKSSLGRYILGGLSIILFMISVEWMTGKQPFSTVISFAKYNIDAHVFSNSYGSMPWFTYFGLLLLVFIPPMSIILLKPFFNGCKEMKLPLSILLIVLIPHLLLSYKLERFILPVIPVFILITLYGLQLNEKKSFYTRVFLTFLWFNLPVMVLTSVSGSQMSSAKGMIELRKKTGKKFIHKINPIWWGYYGYHNTKPQRVDAIEKLVQKVNTQQVSSFYLLNFLALSDNDLKQLLSNKINCKAEKTFWPSLGEQLVISLNPRFNQRRRETVLYYCSS